MKYKFWMLSKIKLCETDDLKQPRQFVWLLFISVSILPFPNITLLNIYVGVNIAWKDISLLCLSSPEIADIRGKSWSIKTYREKSLELFSSGNLVGPHPTSKKPTE